VSSSLAKRILTAVVLIPPVVAAILLAPTDVVAVLFGVVVVAGGWEWAALAGWTATGARAAYALSLAVLVGALHLLVEAPAGTVGVLLAGLAWWVVALVWVLRSERGARPEATAGATGSPLGRPLVAAAVGWLLLVPAWAALVFVHGGAAGGPVLVVCLLALVWVADAGAYFVGRRWGSRRLAPRVSPGKTWEGVAGGMLAALVLAPALGLWASARVGHLGAFVILCLAAVPVSVLGDLAESLFKRHAGVKDSGTLLPGHGGVLDRIDSLTAAAPFFALGLYGIGGPT